MIPGVKDIKVGDKQISKVYAGDKLVWENAKPEEYEVNLYDNKSFESQPASGKFDELFKIVELTKHGEKYHIRIQTQMTKYIGFKIVLEKLILDEKTSVPDDGIFEFNDVRLTDVNVIGDEDAELEELGVGVTYSIRFTGIENYNKYKNKSGYLVFTKKIKENRQNEI